MSKIIDTIKQLLREDKFNRGKYHLPSDHTPGQKVPRGGSMCANCKFFNKDGGGRHGTCEAQYFFDYYGTKELPEPADEFCSDWYSNKDPL